MDGDPALSSIFDSAATFAEYSQRIRPVRPQLSDETCGAKCELQQFDSVYNSEGKRVYLKSGVRRNVNPNSAHWEHTSALVKTRFWKHNGDEDFTEIEIRSPYMKAAIKALVPEFKDFNIDIENITFRNEPRSLFYFRDELFSHGSMLEVGTEPQLHVSFLLQYLYQELSSAIYTHMVRIEFAQNSPSIDFANLWTIFKPGELVYIRQKSPRAVVFNSASVTCRCELQSCLRTHKWNIQGDYFDTDGDYLGYRSCRSSITYFDGYRDLSSLEIFPLKYHPEHEKVRHQLLARGRKFTELQGFQYQQYKGVADVLSQDRNTTSMGVEDAFPIHSSWINGRVIIDPKTFAEARPGNVDVYLNPKKERHSLEITRNGIVLTDEQYIICRPQIAGFALREKAWGYFSVEHINPIDFDDNVFTSSLILKQHYKDTLLSLVRFHSDSSGADFDDIIKGKGKGSVFLLHGEPGVGKTLTAESIADYCKRLLLRIDASTVGTTANSVENGLESAFQLADKWKAIALLDEADVFLEQRGTSDLARNSIVSGELHERIGLYQKVSVITWSFTLPSASRILRRYFISHHKPYQHLRPGIQVANSFVHLLSRPRSKKSQISLA